MRYSPAPNPAPRRESKRVHGPHSDKPSISIAYMLIVTFYRMPARVIKDATYQERDCMRNGRRELLGSHRKLISQVTPIWACFSHLRSL
jgi:hypothetical protein